MEAAWLFEALVSYITQCHNADNHNMRLHYCKTLKSCIYYQSCHRETCGLNKILIQKLGNQGHCSSRVPMTSTSKEMTLLF